MPEDEAMAVGRRRGGPTFAHSIFDSLVAAMASWAGGSLLLEILYHSPAVLWFGDVLDLRLVAFCHAAGIAAGWLVFLLPVAVLHRRGGGDDRDWLMFPLAAAVAFLLTAFETGPLRGLHAGIFSERELYIAVGMLDAVIATTVLLAICRRTARQVLPGA